MPEVEVIVSRDISSLDELRDAAVEIAQTYRVACIAKGGHLEGGDDVGETFDLKIKVLDDADEIIEVQQYIEPQNKLMVLKKSMSTK